MKEEAKMVYLLECLQKTPPPVSITSQTGPGLQGRGGKGGRVACWARLGMPRQSQPLGTGVGFLGQVLIFAEKKADVDAIHEYLLLKGVEAVAIHGGKGQGSARVGMDPAAISPSPNPFPCLAGLPLLPSLLLLL